MSVVRSPHCHVPRPGTFASAATAHLSVLAGLTTVRTDADVAVQCLCQYMPRPRMEYEDEKTFVQQEGGIGTYDWQILVLQCGRLVCQHDPTWVCFAHLVSADNA